MSRDLAHMNHAILQLRSDLPFSLFDDRLMRHPDGHPQRDHRDQQKAITNFKVSDMASDPLAFSAGQMVRN